MINVKNPAYVMGFVVLIAAGFTSAVMVLQVATRAKVERNERLARQRALVGILFRADSPADLERLGLSQPADRMSDQEVLDLFSRRVLQEDLPAPDGGEPIRIAVGYDHDILASDGPGRAEPVGVAVPFAGTGFWDRIEGYVALTSDLKRIQGLAVLSQKETPGLGGRIEEPRFRRQFVGLDTTPPPPGGQYVYVVRDLPAEGDPRYGRSFEAITGATQTSRAMAGILNNDLARFRAAARDDLPHRLGIRPAQAPEGARTGQEGGE